MLLHGLDPPGRAPVASSALPLLGEGTALSRWANLGYITRRTDTPANTLIPARVIGDPVVGVSVIDTLGVGGRAALTVGELMLSNHDRALDDAVRFGRMENRRIRLRVGEVQDLRASDCGVPFSAIVPTFVGRVARVSQWSHLVRLELTDLLEIINGPLQSVTYAGTGGLDGPAVLAGLPKPVALGECFNVAPVYLGNVDLGVGTLPTYQTHWRAIDGHTAVRERGVEMDEVGGTPGIGQWRDWPAHGAFQIGFSPAGAITCDVRGDADPFWAATTTEVVTRILTSLVPGLDASAFDTRSFDRAAIDLPGTIGWYAGAEAATVGQALDAVCAGASAHLWTTRGGTIGIAALRAPESAPDATIDHDGQIEIEALPAPATFAPLPSAIEVEHGRNWTVLSDIAGSVPEALRARLRGDAQLARAVSSVAALFTGRSRALRLPGLYAAEADAQDRAAALRALVDRLPVRLRVVTDRYRGRLDIGMTVRVARADVTGGWWSGVVMGWREWLGSQRVELDLWG